MHLAPWRLRQIKAAAGRACILRGGMACGASEGTAVRQTSIWVLVADGARARVFAGTGRGIGLSEVEEGSFSGDRRPSRALRGDRPGRTFDSAGPGRHAKEPPSDPHRLAESAFLRETVAWLAERERAGAFERLVVIAAPRALGELRGLLPEALTRRLAGELAADLTRASAAEIEARLRDLPRP